ncbi:type I secretion system permease/ATPase [Thermolongibacillus altinsuensis]
MNNVVSPLKRDEMEELHSGLKCLLLIMKFYGTPFDLRQIIHNYALGNEKIEPSNIIKIAQDYGYKSKFAKIKMKHIDKLPKPAIIRTIEEEYLVLANVENEKFLVLHPSENRPKIIDKREFEFIWDGTIILFTKRNIEKVNGSFGLGWFIPYVTKYKVLFFEVLLAAFIIQLFGLITPIFTQVLIDKVLVHNGLSTLHVLTIGLLGIALFEFILSIAKGYVFTHTTSKIDVSLGSYVYKHLLKLPLSYFEKRRIGDTVARVRELENIRQFLTGTPLTSIIDSFFIVVFIIVMFYYSPTLTYIVLLSLPIYIALSLIITPLLRKRLDEKFSRGAENQSFLVESVSGMQSIKSLALEPQFNKKWEEKLASYTDINFRTAVLSNNAGSIGQFIQRVLFLAILWKGAFLVLDGVITVGQLIAFQMLASRVSGPILRLVQLWQDFQQTGIAIKRIGDIFNSPTEVTGDSTKLSLPNIRGHIRLENVRFRYNVDGPEILRNISLDIRPGMTVGIVGRSGSGKSTLSKLIQRLYIPESGKILIDGIDISLADTSWLRRQIGVVLQENFLFTGTVRENISIHYPSASMEQIVQAARLAGAHEFILELPNGYDTVIGEQGVGLSGGQKQRIAIARALITNPRILILDEATSALDYESERIIQRNLTQIAKGRTVIIIAHRLSTLRTANKIVVMDKGKIIEVGTHEELMSRPGLYKYLYEQQQREV